MPAQLADLARRWPLLDEQTYGPYPDAPACARLHARAILWEWGLATVSGDAEVVVDELVANAITATAVLPEIFPVRIWLVSEGRWLLVLVWDASREPPRPQEPTDLFAENGRGLLLVQGLSARWGWHFAPGTVGKTVWALLPVPGGGNGGFPASAAPAGRCGGGR